MSSSANSQLFGFPPGYFVIRSDSTGRLLDVAADWVEDGADVILYPEKEKSLVESLRNPDANNQVFFVDTSGALCSRSSGHALDIENDRLVLRHRRPISQPYPNAYSHPFPRFAYSRQTKEIIVTSAWNYDSAQTSSTSTSNQKAHILAALPITKRRSVFDNASEFFSTAVNTSFSLISGKPSSHHPKPEEVFDGDFDLKEDEVLEQDRGIEGEADDSPDLARKVRIITVNPRDPPPYGANAQKRRQWTIQPLRVNAARRFS